MKKKKARITLIILSIFAFIGWSDNISSIKNEAKKVKSLQAKFIQEKHIKNILRKPLISRGRLFYSAPSSLRWEYNYPRAISSIVLMHDNDLEKYILKGERYIKTSSQGIETMQIVLKEISNWLNGEFEKSKNFKVKLIKSPKKKIVLTPVKKELQSIIQRIELYPSKRAGVVKYLKIVENINSYTIIKFQKAKINKNIKESTFKDIR